MRRALIAAAVALCLLIHSGSSYGKDPWDDYEQFSKQFYRLSEQSFDQIECRIVLPQVEETYNEHSRQMGKATEGSVELIHNLSNFKMTYSKTDGLSFSRPSIEIRIKSDDKIKDRQKYASGKQMIVNAHNNIINGTSDIISGIFGSYEKLKKENISLLSVDIYEDKSEFKYKDGITDIFRSCSKNRCTHMSKNEQMEILMDENYINIGNKLAMASASGTMKNSSAEMHVNTKIEYQEVENVFFPSSILTEFYVQSSSMEMEMTAKFDIRFQDVQIK